MTAVVRPDNGQDEGRCSGDGCWYSLPVVDGLIVSHSAPMTLDNCEGSGRPPLASGRTGAGEQQREIVGQWLCGHYGTGEWDRRTEQAKATWLRSADELLALLTPESES